MSRHPRHPAAASVTLLPTLLLLATTLAAGSDAQGGIPSAPFVELPWAPHGTTSQARYGQVVAPAGDVNGDGFSDVLVGAPKEEGPDADAGKVYLYLGSASGLAATPAWSWSANQASGLTGTAVAAAGDLNGDGYGDVVVGTPQFTVSGNANAGKISIFHGGPSGLPATPSAERTAPAPTAGAKFGFAVATAGNVNGDAYDDVIVGAPFHTANALSGRGAAFVYHGSATGIEASPARTYLGAEAGANLGRAVSTAGDVDADGFSDVLIGAPFALFEAVACGTASLYRGSETGLLVAADTVIGGDRSLEEVGAAVANAGDVDGDGYADVLIGRPGYNNAGLNKGGYDLFRGGPGGLVSPPVLAVRGQDEGLRLGAALATLGDLNADGYADFAVSAPADSVQFWEASVFVYLGPPVQFYFPTPLVSSAGQAANFGHSLATAGDVDGDGFSEFLVGDPNASVAFGAKEGTAALFELPRSRPVVMPDWPTETGQPNTLHGAAVAISPGLDASGFGRLINSEPGYDAGFDIDIGRVRINAGTRAGASFIPLVTIDGQDPVEAFGAQLADAGDIDRDGYTDVLISSPNRIGTPGTESGRVSLLRGAENVAASTLPVLEGDQEFARVGSAISGRGDVDGDGYHDVVIGARDWDGGPGLADCGKVWVLFGGAAGFEPTPWTVEGTAAGQGLGASVAIGDLDGDAFGDVLVASVSPLLTSPPPGKVVAYYGSASGPSATPAWQIGSSEPSPSFGSALSAVGDVNGDGMCDIAVGAPDEAGFGRIFLFQGGGGRGAPRLAWSRRGTQLESRFGAAIAGGGDVDGDGIGDFVVGEPRYDSGLTDVGRVHLFHGGPADPQLGWTYESNAALNELGTALSRLVDLNDDGFADFAAGGPATQGGPGRVYAFAGGGGVGLMRSLSLLRDVSSNPYFHYPVRLDADQQPFVSWVLRSAEGRGRVSGQVEVAVHNEPFTGAATIQTPFYDTGAPNAGFGSETGVVSQLTLPWMGTAYTVRARSRSTSPFFPGSRWLRAESHASGSHDFYRAGAEVAVGDGPTGGALVAPRLGRIAPNPMPSAPAGVAAAARIAYDLPRATRALVEVFDVRGTRVRRLVDEARPAGASTATWDGRDERGRTAPAGLYFVRLAAEGVVDQGRLVRLP